MEEPKHPNTATQIYPTCQQPRTKQEGYLPSHLGCDIVIICHSHSPTNHSRAALFLSARRVFVLHRTRAQSIVSRTYAAYSPAIRSRKAREAGTSFARFREVRGLR